MSNPDPVNPVSTTPEVPPSGVPSVVPSVSASADSPGVTSPAELGEGVRSRRLSLGLTLATLSERVGCSVGHLSAIETGRRGPPGDALLERLERALGYQSGELVVLAAWSHTPGPVRRELVIERAKRLEAERQAERFRALMSAPEAGEGTALDRAYRSGELAALIDGRARPGAEGVDLEGGSGGSGVAASPNAAPVPLPHEVPLINRVSAGYPAEFTDLGYPARVADDYVRCPDIRDPDAFAARVVGDSMEPDYREGDIVVFSPARAAESGQDCFVRTEPNHESTFKRVYFGEEAGGAGLIRLQPLNSRYPPRVLPREQVAGVYAAVTVIRSIG